MCFENNLLVSDGVVCGSACVSSRERAHVGWLASLAKTAINNIIGRVGY